MHIASKLRLDFNITTLTFADKYPERDLANVMTRGEFETVLRRINLELAARLHENAESIRRWFKIVGVSSIFLVGILLLPVLLHKSGHQAKLLSDFQDDVKEYLYKLNKKKYLKRKIEWKLIKDKRDKNSNKDIVNPESQLRIELIYESNTSKMINKRISMVQMTDGQQSTITTPQLTPTGKSSTGTQLISGTHMTTTENSQTNEDEEKAVDSDYSDESAIPKTSVFSTREDEQEDKTGEKGSSSTTNTSKRKHHRHHHRDNSGNSKKENKSDEHSTDLFDKHALLKELGRETRTVRSSVAVPSANKGGGGYRNNEEDDEKAQNTKKKVDRWKGMPVQPANLRSGKSHRGELPS